MKTLDIQNYRGHNIKKLEVGDKISAQGYTFEIAEIISQDYWGDYIEDNPDWDWGFYCEFLDPKGNYHYWKQQFDGGRVIAKE